MKAFATMLVLAVLAWTSVAPAQPASTEARFCLPAWVPGRLRDEVLRAAEADDTSERLSLLGVRVDRDTLSMDVAWAGEPITVRAVPGGSGSPSDPPRWMRFYREDSPGTQGTQNGLPAPVQRILQRAEAAIDRDPWLPCGAPLVSSLCERAARGDTSDGPPPSLLPVSFRTQMAGYLVLLGLIAAAVIRAVRRRES